MNRDDYEIYLLEIRQCLKDAHKELINLGCVDILKFRRVKEATAEVQAALENHSSNQKVRKKANLKLMEG